MPTVHDRATAKLPYPRQKFSGVGVIKRSQLPRSLAPQKSAVKRRRQATHPVDHDEKRSIELVTRHRRELSVQRPRRVLHRGQIRQRPRKKQLRHLILKDRPARSPLPSLHRNRAFQRTVLLSPRPEHGGVRPHRDREKPRQGEDAARHRIGPPFHGRRFLPGESHRFETSPARARRRPAQRNHPLGPQRPIPLEKRPHRAKFLPP